MVRLQVRAPPLSRNSTNISTRFPMNWHSKWNQSFDLLTDWPVERPQNWIEFVNAPDNASELDDRPFGSADWVIVMAKQLGLESTMKSRGRPKRAEKDSRPL
jgi:putative transposase